jgi:hypothetical protein
MIAMLLECVTQSNFIDDGCDLKLNLRTRGTGSSAERRLAQILGQKQTGNKRPQIGRLCKPSRCPLWRKASPFHLTADTSNTLYRSSIKQPTARGHLKVAPFVNGHEIVLQDADDSGASGFGLFS